jgi:hypothetical protein
MLHLLPSRLLNARGGGKFIILALGGGLSKTGEKKKLLAVNYSAIKIF